MSFKCVLVGDEFSGKSSFVAKLRGCFDPSKKYSPTIGVEVIPLDLNTSHGKITLNIWDCAGDSRYCGLRDVYYIGAHCAIIFSAEKNNLTFWQNDVFQVCQNIPMELVKNKIDILGSDSSLTNISIKTNINCMDPIRNILVKITGDKNIVIY